MHTLGLIIFYVGSVCGVICGFAMTAFHAEARELAEKEGGGVPCPLRTDFPIDVGCLRGVVAVAARKSNNHAVLMLAFVIIGAGGAVVAVGPLPGVIIPMAVLIIFPIWIAAYTFRVHRQQAPGMTTGAGPEVHS